MKSFPVLIILAVQIWAIPDSNIEELSHNQHKLSSTQLNTDTTTSSAYFKVPFFINAELGFGVLPIDPIPKLSSDNGLGYNIESSFGFRDGKHLSYWMRCGFNHSTTFLSFSNDSSKTLNSYGLMIGTDYGIGNSYVSIFAGGGIGLIKWYETVNVTSSICVTNCDNGGIAGYDSTSTTIQSQGSHLNVLAHIGVSFFPTYVISPYLKFEVGMYQGYNAGLGLQFNVK